MSNSDNLSIPFDAITDYLTGAATQQELDEIDAWRALSADNGAYFAQMKEDLVLHSGRTASRF